MLSVCVGVSMRVAPCTFLFWWVGEVGSWVVQVEESNRNLVEDDLGRRDKSEREGAVAENHSNGETQVA